jgi:hypothetical protein
MVASADSTEPFDHAFNRFASTRLAPSRTARLTARLRGSSLDVQLVNGADPASSPVLAARAVALSSRRARTAMAEGLTRLVEEAHGRQRRWWALGQHEPIRANADALSGLAGLLRSSQPLHARGIAMLQVLLTESDGPCFRGDARLLAGRLERARELMIG